MLGFVFIYLLQIRSVAPLGAKSCPTVYSLLHIQGFIRYSFWWNLIWTITLNYFILIPARSIKIDQYLEVARSFSSFIHFEVFAPYLMCALFLAGERQNTKEWKITEVSNNSPTRSPHYFRWRENVNMLRETNVIPTYNALMA